MATHHGTSVYKVFSPLLAFDPGVDPHLGTTVRLESHHQQPLTDPLTAEIVDPLHFDVSSPALLLQFLLPLLVIFLGFSGITREREQGTLPLVLSSGVTWRRLVGAKVLTSCLLISAILCLPLLGLGWWLPRAAAVPELAAGDLVTRFVLLIGCLGLYLVGWACLS